MINYKKYNNSTWKIWKDTYLERLKNVFLFLFAWFAFKGDIITLWLQINTIHTCIVIETQLSLAIRLNEGSEDNHWKSSEERECKEEQLALESGGTTSADKMTLSVSGFV